MQTMQLCALGKVTVITVMFSTLTNSMPLVPLMFSGEIEGDRSSRPGLFLEKGFLKICSKYLGEHPCQSSISIKLKF